MGVTVRPELAEIPDYIPGRKIAGAIVLSSNEVALPPPEPVLTAINAAAADVNRYPAMANDDVMAAVARRYEVDPARVAIGCGSVSLCQQLIQAICRPGEEVVFPWRSFEAYPILTQVVGARPRTVPLTREHRFDLDAIRAAIGEATRLVFLSNPNNPTGTPLRTAELTRFLDSVPDDVLVVLDEAYREFVTDPDVPDGLELMSRYDNLAVLRTFSKAYGLAGARVGFGVAQPAVAAGVRKVGLPFAVNRLAQAAAVAALDAANELLPRCARVVEERERVRPALLDMGYDIPETQANFVWLPLGGQTARFNEHCLDHKVIVRAFVGDGARVTIGLPEENDAFLAAARGFPRG
jgi:histidinol-phosphate aminotransferase